MAPDEPTWDDTGFDPDGKNEGGFLPPDPQKKRVEPTPAASAAPPPPPPSQGDKGKRRSGRGGLFWVGTIAAIVLAVAIIGGGIYWLTMPSAEEEAFFAGETEETSSTAEPLNGSTAESSTAEPGADMAANELEVMDTTVAHDEDALDLLFGDEDKATSSTAEPLNNSTAESSTAKPVDRSTAEPVKKPTTTTTKSTTPKPTTTTTAKTTTTKPAARPKTTAAPSTNEPLYVIQVFSSPSRTDADEWLQLLRTKNVDNGYITEQKIKGESWYRVRFGRFTTRKAAEAEAIRLGFKEPWITRVR